MSNLGIMMAVALTLAAPRAWAQASADKPAAPKTPATAEPAKAAPKASAAPEPTKTAPKAAHTAPPAAAEPAPAPDAHAPHTLPPLGYGPPPGYTLPPGYDPPPGYGPPPGYTLPPGYGAPPGYGPPGYGRPHGYLHAAPGRDAGYHLHDGFFLRVAAGPSYTYLNVANNDQDATASLSGFGGAIDITVGGALMPGLILAGSLNAAFFSEPKLTAKSGSTIDGDGVLHDQTLNLFMLSILADYYLHAERGLHFGGSFGVGGSEIQDKKTDRTSALHPGGVAVSLHAGYEWWVADDWSIGVMGRLTYMHLSDSVIDSAFGTTVKLTQSGILPTLTASFTFN